MDTSPAIEVDANREDVTTSFVTRTNQIMKTGNEVVANRKAQAAAAAIAIATTTRTTTTRTITTRTTTDDGYCDTFGDTIPTSPQRKTTAIN